MSSRRAKLPDRVALPPGTIELTDQLVPVVRQILQRGLPEDFLRSCVRIGGFKAFGGGLKADMVGGLRVDIHAVLEFSASNENKHARQRVIVSVSRMARRHRSLVSSAADHPARC